MATLFPLVVLPGIERPFSAPKIVLLGGFIVIGGIIALSTGRFSWPKMPTAFRLCLIIWPSALIASVVSGDFVSYETLLLPLFSMGWFLLVVAIRPKEDLIALGMAAASVAVAAIALLQYLELDPFLLLGWTAPFYGSPRMRVFATLGNPNFVAAYLVAGMPLSIYLGRRLKRRLLFSFVICLEVVAVFATGSRAAVLALLAMLFWLSVVRPFARLPLMAAGMLLIVLLLALMPSRSLATTINGRFYIWRVAASHLLERPLFGYGPGAFEPKYIQWETQYWRDGRGSADEREFAALQAHAHNDYLETLVDSGLAGLLSFLGLLGSFLVYAFRRARREGSELIAAASTGVIALAVVALVDFPFHRPTELFMLWSLMAMVCLETN